MRKLLLVVFALFLTGTVSFAQLTGSYSIPGSYASVAAAIADLNTQGVGLGGVTFNIAGGYAETFLSATSGTISTTTGSAANPIVFQKSGAGANPVLTAFQLPAASTTGAIIKLAGTDYVTFDGIDVAENALNTTNKTYWGYAILMASATDASQHIQIKNCSITLDKTNVNSVGIYSKYHNATSVTAINPTVAAGTISYCDIDNCQISNVYSGISFTGYAAPSPYTLYGQSNRFGFTTGNSITNFGGGSATQSYGIFTSYQNNLVIARNTVNGGTGTTGGLNGIYNGSSLNANVDIYQNTVTLSHSTTGTSALNGIANIGSSTGSTNTININDNIVENCTNPAGSTTNWYLIYNSGSAMTCNVFNNIVRNNTRTASSATVYMIGLTAASFIGTENVYGNQVYGNVVTGGSVSIFYGLYCTNTATNRNIYLNTIYSNSTTGSSVYGIYTQNGTTTKLSQNNIYDITTNHTTGIAYGMKFNGGTNIYCYNNLISDIKAPLTSSIFALRGISVDAGTNVGLYYNTIYLNGTGSSTNFGSACVYAATATALEMRNNVLVNTSVPLGTGSTIAYWRASTTLSTYAAASGNNDFYAGTPGIHNLIFYDGTNSYQNLADYKTLVSPADGNSFTEMPPFVNAASVPYNLHINTAIPTQCESAGSTVASPVNITLDFDEARRYPNPGYPNNPGHPAIAPDAGAFEFAGIPVDLSAPSIGYSPLQNTSLFTDRTLTATITDANGVPTSGSGLPVCYWKINAGSYSSAQGVNVAGTDKYTFVFGAGVTTADVVSYYIVAQDAVATPNVGANPSAGSGGFTSSPPACSTPPTTPYTYTVIPSLSGDVTVGTGGTYPSLTGAGGLFQDINAKSLTGNLNATVISNLTEDGTYSLNRWIEDPPGNFTVTIRPDGTTERLIEGATAKAMIRLSGAQHASIDGRYSESGKYLRFRNTNTGFSVIELTNDSRYNTIRNCYFESGNTATGTAVSGVFRIYNTTGANGNSNNTVQDNVIRDLSSGSSQPYSGIYMFGTASAFNSNNTISGNEVANFTNYGIYVNSYNDSVVLSGNSLYNNMATPLTQTARCINVASGTGCEANIIAGNYIGGTAAMCGGTPWIQNSSGGIYGLNLSVGSVVPTEVYNNVFSNIHSIHTGSGSFYGISCNSGVFHIGDLGANVIGSGTTPNSIVLDGSNAFRGIYSVGTDPGNTCVNNIIGNITWTVATGSQTGIYGITFYGGTASKNKVFNLSATQAGFVPTIYGIGNYGAAGVTTVYANNLVDLDGGAATNPILYGFWDGASTSSSTNLYFNTFYIHGPATTTSSTYAWKRNTGAIVGLNNNIFFNDRAAGGTGNHFAVYDNVTASLTSDYNDIYSTAGPQGYSGAANVMSLSAWQTATSGDAHSVSVNPNFISATDLHPTNPNLNNSGIAIPGITKDFAGITRNNPPDIGALEFQATPLVATTTATGITSAGATVNGTVNALGESVTTSFEYGLTLSYGSSVPATPVTVGGSVVIAVSATLSGLSMNTTYHFRAIGVTSSGTTYGNDMEFTTDCLVPGPAGTVSGPAVVSQSETGIAYSVAPVANATGYTWSLPTGASIASGANSNSITVDFSASAVSGNISVYATNSCANGTVSPSLFVTVIPSTNNLLNIVVANGESNCYDATQTIYVAGGGNTFTVQNGGSATMIAGQNIVYLPGTTVEPGGYMHGYITTDNQYCGGMVPSMVNVVAGTEQVPSSLITTSYKVYPNPTPGEFTVEFSANDIQPAKANIFNMNGVKVLSADLNGEKKHEFSISSLPAGIYMIHLSSGKSVQVVKIVKL
ncbi:MAG: T9SS type A sorting domain-containing protein [Bacteroidetes bacterium]|nr:T9SS type A sorting domain-containing protein [Bacteroidota bacterium]